VNLQESVRFRATKCRTPIARPGAAFCLTCTRSVSMCLNWTNGWHWRCLPRHCAPSASTACMPTWRNFRQRAWPPMSISDLKTY